MPRYVLILNEDEREVALTCGFPVSNAGFTLEKKIRRALTVDEAVEYMAPVAKRFRSGGVNFVNDADRARAREMLAQLVGALHQETDSAAPPPADVEASVVWDGDNIVQVLGLMQPVAEPVYMKGFSNADEIVGVPTPAGLKVAQIGDTIVRRTDATLDLQEADRG